MTLKLSAAEAGARRDRIVEAATGVFLRYGYARTTMGDIADAAGISRPALYPLFPKKEDIFASVISQLNEEKLQEFRIAFSRLRSLDRKLHLCCEDWGAHGFDLVQIHPDAKDLFDLEFPAVQKIYSDFAKFVAELIADTVNSSAFKGQSEHLARNLVFSMRGLKEAARSGSDMRRMIALSVDTLLAAIRSQTEG